MWKKVDDEETKISLFGGEGARSNWLLTTY